MGGGGGVAGEKGNGRAELKFYKLVRSSAITSVVRLSLACLE